MQWLKRHTVLLLIFILAFVLISLVIFRRDGAGNLTDAAFFGVWNGTSWSQVGKLNYAYNNGALSAVEASVKANDYHGAKAELLKYYRNRKDRTVTPINKGDRNLANLACNLTFSGPASDSLETEISVNAEFATVSANVLHSVNESIGKTNVVGYMLMGKTKENSIAEFYSREHADKNKRPRLELVIDGAAHVLSPSKDSYITGNSTTNYSSSTSLLVRAGGIPYDDSETRAYIIFDLSRLPQNKKPSSAVLKLYGRNQSAFQKGLYVFRTGNTGFVETAINWTNTLGQIYSWQGAAGGVNWNAPKYADNEYLHVITRFTFAPAMAYELSIAPEDTFYSGNLIHLMTDFIKDKPAGYPVDMDVAIRIGNWISSYEYIKKSRAMSDSANTEILKFIWQEQHFLADPANFTTIGNHGVIDATGQYQASVYFPEFIDAANWQALAENRLLYILSKELKADNSFEEATTGYISVVLGLYASVKNFARINNQKLNQVLDDKLRNFAYFGALSTASDGSDPVYGDSDPMDNTGVIYGYGLLYDDPYLKYFGSGGSEGTIPPVTSVLYPVGQIATMRSGWNKNDLFMHFNDGTAILHGHPDLLSVVAYAYGRQLLVNSGKYSYTPDPISNWLRTTTEAKNTVEVDDMPMNRNASAKIISHWETNSGFDFVEASHNGYAGITSVRDILFIKSGYWIISDIEKSISGIHNYDQLWHFLPSANLAIDPSTNKTYTAFSEGANIQIVPADPADITASLRDGYYSTGYGSVVAAKYVAYEKNNAAGSTTFDAILYPTMAGDRRNVTVTRLGTIPASPVTMATAFKVNMGSGDFACYYLSRDTVPVTRGFDAYTCDGKMAYVQTGGSGVLKEAGIVRGKTLKKGNTSLINAVSTVQGLHVEWKGKTLALSGMKLKADTSTTNGIAIYAPSVTTVTLNGTTIPYTKAGNYVHAVESH